MPRYTEEFELLSSRVLRQSTIDLETEIALRLSRGARIDSIVADLVDDLDNNGPLFGPFLRRLGGAASNAAMTAARQGALMGHVRQDAALRQLLARAGVDGGALDAVIEEADADAAAEIEELVADDIEETWIGTLFNTCERCLPLHGHTRTRAEWTALGLLPETMHDGWGSACQCRLVPVDLAGGRTDLVAPLKRLKGEPGSGRTKRAVLQADLDKALAARDAAVESKKGRAVLRRLGKAGADEDE